MQQTQCNEKITNPICVECLSKEMEAWFSETKPSLVEKMKDIMNIYLGMEPLNNCIICGNELVVCKPDFTKEVFNGLIKGNKRLEEDFIRQFNYELTGF